MRNARTIVLAVLVGAVGAGCSTQIVRSDPERSFSLPNDTHGPRLLHRCQLVDDCRSPKNGKTVQPGESFEFDMYADEERSYVVSDGEGKILGCITIHVADGSQPYPPDSLSDTTSCPPGTPKTS